MIKNYLIVCGVVAFLLLISLIIIIKKNLQKRKKLKKCKSLATWKMQQEKVIISRSEVERIICYEFKVYTIEEIIPDHTKVLEFVGSIIVPTSFAEKIKKGFFPKLSDFYENATIQLVCEIGSLSLVEHVIKTHNEPLKLIDYLILKNRGIKYSDLIFLGSKMELDLIKQLCSINLYSKNEEEEKSIDWLYEKAIRVLYGQGMPDNDIYEYVESLVKLRETLFDLLVSTERFHTDTLPIWPDFTESEFIKIINFSSGKGIEYILREGTEKFFMKLHINLWEKFIVLVDKSSNRLSTEQNLFLSKLIKERTRILANPSGYN